MEEAKKKTRLEEQKKNKPFNKNIFSVVVKLF